MNDNLPGYENGMLIGAGVLLNYRGSREEVIIPEGVREISARAFQNVYARYMLKGRLLYKPYEDNLTSIVLPKTLKVIGANAFDGRIALKSIEIPEGVEQIGAEAFMGCRALKSINIPKSVKMIGEDAFRECSSLKMFAVDEENAYYSAQDGMLVNKGRDTIIWFPAGKAVRAFSIPENIQTIAAHAFIDNYYLKKIKIPASVRKVGDEAFSRRGYWDTALQTIEVDPDAGDGTVGENVFDIYEGNRPLVYPKIPVTFVKEKKIRVALALGFCQEPGKYSDKYAEGYRKFVKSYEKTLRDKAIKLKLGKVIAYLDSVEGSVPAKGNGYAPNLSLKNPSGLRKVTILEETVQKGTREDLEAVLKTYKPFEITARALGLAARYRGVEYVEVLSCQGASFCYKKEGLQGKYMMMQKTAAGTYFTEYYLMAVLKDRMKPEEYSYSPLAGIENIPVIPGLKPLSVQDRIKTVLFLHKNPMQGVSMGEMLFWALTDGELEMADALMDMGTDLNEKPSYYSREYGPGGDNLSWLDIITLGNVGVYWNNYVSQLSRLDSARLCPVLERPHRLADAKGKKLVISQEMMDEITWDESALAFILKHADLSKINKKKALEKAVSEGDFASLVRMADAGWLKTRKSREDLITFAGENKYMDSLAWLLDYKNRTVDIEEELAREVRL